MAQLIEIVQYLDQLLDPSQFHDSAINGLQVESEAQEVTKVAFAVDAGLSVIEQAVHTGAQLLITHHGMFWGNEKPITGPHGARIRRLILGRCSLYASHLPLDANIEIGNNIELARFFGLEDPEPFADYKGQKIGFKGRVQGREFRYFEEKAKALTGSHQILSYPFGKKHINSVGIVSGGAADAIFPSGEEGLDLLITGEPTQWAYHEAKDRALNVIFAGHYATETTGILALKNKLENELGVSTVFIHEPTGV